MKKIKRIVIIALLGAAMLWLAGNDLPKLPWPLFRQAQEDAEPVAPDTGSYRYYIRPIETETETPVCTETTVWSIQG